MDVEQLEILRYPIGKFLAPAKISKVEIDNFICDLEDLPALFRKEMEGLSKEMLDEEYRPGGWTARQVVHHVADSHMNAYIRFKLTLTEDLPTIKPYKESLWAELSDAKNGHPELSLSLLDAIHRRFVVFLRSIPENEFDRRYFHPESKKEFDLKTALALYSWHGKHHLEHIRNVKRKFDA